LLVRIQQPGSVLANMPITLIIPMNQETLKVVRVTSNAMNTLELDRREPGRPKGQDSLFRCRFFPCPPGFLEV
jgi:hypothetical protein